MRIEITDVQRDVLAKILPEFSACWSEQIIASCVPQVHGYWLTLSPVPEANVDLLSRIEAAVDTAASIHESRAALLLGLSIRNSGVSNELVEN